jgi:uncharacterized NAD-dependent epimerase/dehydratase family protein
MAEQPTTVTRSAWRAANAIFDDISDIENRSQAQAQADQDITTERFVFCRQVAEIIDRATTLPSLLRAIKREAVSCVFCGGSKRYAGKECTCVHLHKALSDAGEHPKATDRATAPTPGRGRE